MKIHWIQQDTARYTVIKKSAFNSSKISFFELKCSEHVNFKHTQPQTLSFRMFMAEFMH